MDIFADRWHVDTCQDANGFSTVRFADGTEHGRTDCGPVATVYVDTLAPLVAAAPDMLAALLEILGDLGGRPGVMHLPSIHTARSAIAKARGQ